MKTFGFTLKSGAKLQVTMASFRVSFDLIRAIKDATKENPANVEIGDVLVTSPAVESALFAAFDTVLYDNLRITVALLDDPRIGEKVRNDFFEICERVIEVNAKPFFLRNFSASMNGQPSQPESPVSPSGSGSPLE